MDGSWGPWLPWEQCTASCDGGIQRRERHCNYPPPTHGGRDCAGAGVEEKACNEEPCPGMLAMGVSRLYGGKTMLVTKIGHFLYFKILTDNARNKLVKIN